MSIVSCLPRYCPRRRLSPPPRLRRVSAAQRARRGRLQPIKCEPFHGYVNAIRNARGRYVVYLSDDDVLLGDSLRNYLHMLEAARQKGSAPEMRRLLDVLERCQPEQSGGSDEKALRQAHRLAAARYEAEPEGLRREVQRFAQCAPAQAATAQDAEALAIAVSSLAPWAAQWPQSTAWADMAVSAMEKGGRQDLLFVEALFARGRFRQAAGDQGGSTDIARAGRFASRLGLNWLMDRLQKT